jgi:WD40 repeat protein
MPMGRIRFVNSRIRQLLRGGIAYCAWILIGFLFVGNDAASQDSTPALQSSTTVDALASNCPPESRAMLDGVPSILRLPPLPGEAESPVITALAIASDGSRIAAAGDDHAIRLVSCHDGSIEGILFGHGDWVQSMEFSRNGDVLASCAKDGSIYLWKINPARSDASSRDSDLPRQPVASELAHRIVDHALFTVGFHGDHELFAAGFNEAIYHFQIDKLQWKIDRRSECRDIRTIACSHDGKLIAYAGRDGIIRIEDLQSEFELGRGDLKRVHALAQPAHFDRVRSLAFTIDDSQLVSVGEDRRIVRLDVQSGAILSQLDLSAGKLMALQLLDDSLAAVSGSDNTIRIVDIQRGRIVSKLVGHDGSIAVLKRTDSYLLSAGFDTTLRKWNIQQSIHELDRSGRFIHPVAAQFEDSSAQESIR